MAVVVAVLMTIGVAESLGQIFHARGQNVVPVFEGWETNRDGSFNLLFGYMNRNYEEILDVAIGPNNSFDAGVPDQGQPTHFFPRRQMFVFRVKVPKDFGKKELVWTLTANGKTEKTYASLRPEYALDDRIIMMNAGGFGLKDEEARNKAPIVGVEGPLERTISVGEPLALAASASDDGIPAPKTGVRESADGGTVLAVGGFRVGWFVYRGAGRVVFTPEQFHPGIRRKGSTPIAVPASPLRNGRLEVTATFHDPGTYVLQLMGHDGGLASTQNVTVTVVPAR